VFQCGVSLRYVFSFVVLLRGKVSHFGVMLRYVLPSVISSYVLHSESFGVSFRYVFILSLLRGKVS